MMCCRNETSHNVSLFNQIFDFVMITSGKTQFQGLVYIYLLNLIYSSGLIWVLGSLFHSRTNLDKFSRTACPIQLFRALQLTYINLVNKKVWNWSIASVLSILTRLKVFDVLCHHFCSIHRIWLSRTTFHFSMIIAR